MGWNLQLFERYSYGLDLALNFSNGIRTVRISTIARSVIVLDGFGRSPTTFETRLDTTVATIDMVVEVLFEGECWEMWQTAL